MTRETTIQVFRLNGDTCKYLKIWAGPLSYDVPGNLYCWVFIS
nr:MAG TPA: hypothetical protein [Bacteriophage sp.]